MKTQKRHTIWQLMEIFPPVACRLLAKTSGTHPRLLTDNEISIASGLPLTTVQSLSQATDWEHVATGIMRRFCQACGTDFANHRQVRRALQYIRVGLLAKTTYLRRDEHWNLKWEPMLNKWLAYLRTRHAGK